MGQAQDDTNEILEILRVGFGRQSNDDLRDHLMEWDRRELVDVIFELAWLRLESER